MGTLKQTNKVYFVQPDPSDSETFIFYGYQQLSNWINEMVFEGEDVKEYNIWSAIEEEVKHPKVQTVIEVPE